MQTSLLVGGAFPTLLALITIFFAMGATGVWQSVLSAIILTGIIALGVAATFLASRFLSGTVLKGTPSSFTLELPPYRKPQVAKVLVRSLFDRTLFVLGRAVSVAAPAGLIIWLMSNIVVGDVSLLAHCAGVLDPFARLLGMDGIIMMAFILGFPANEIVLPIILMAYLSQGTLMEPTSMENLRTLLLDNGWTGVTAICVMLFSLMHWPCSTTCLTIRKETESMKWTAVAFVLPTVLGMAACFLVATVARLLGLGL